ncbi:MAG TPA: DUF2461 domain-containing protein [Bryobacteraceae bacterium]|nr:DUF2461 domain-containing protein [Bryobacteraceae bacterium]
MSTRFPGFPPEALDFFRELRNNNQRDWFQPRKMLYEEQVKRPMRELVETLNRALAPFAPEYATDPDKAVYRIYRDTRFSPDKTPYKDHIAASFHRRSAGAQGEGGFYVAVSDKEAAIGGGVYAPGPETLLALRQHIATKHEEMRKILRAAAVRKLLGEMQGDKLSRVPKGFASDHPAADLLRFKSFVLYVTLPPEVAATPEFYGEILKRFRAMTPFLKFLAAAPKAKPVRIAR